MAEGDRQVRRRQVASKVVDGGDQSDQLQLRWVQSVREFVHARRDALYGFQRSRQPLRAVHLQLIGTEPIELDGQDRELLIDVVVQFTGNAGAFRLLFAEQPSAQVANSFVAHPQHRLTATQLALATAQREL